MRVFILIALVLAAPVMAQSVHVGEGSGSFNIAGGEGREDKKVSVFYYRPTTFTHDSRVMMVIPGAGRNGWSYRDAWIDAAEKHGLLILSLHYPDDSYPEFWSYNLANTIDNVELNSDRTNIIGFEINRNPADWIFNDFDRIFDLVKAHLELRTKNYDMFGHSAGGQILHRLALFRPNGKARRVVAANSGWYTVPTFDDEFPYGVEGMLTPDQRVAAFSTKLILLLGELDDRNEKRGHLVRTPQVDIQGLSRLERGNYFYTKAAETAERLNADMEWQLEVIPNVGHDYRRMSKAAADYLY